MADEATRQTNGNLMMDRRSRFERVSAGATEGWWPPARPGIGPGRLGRSAILSESTGPKFHGPAIHAVRQRFQTEQTPTNRRSAGFTGVHRPARRRKERFEFGELCERQMIYSRRPISLSAYA